MLDGERGQVRVGYQICRGVPRVEHTLEDLPMLLRRMDHTYTRLVDPALHAVHRFLERQRPLMQPGICGDAHESRKNGPAQAYWGAPAELCVPPGSCRFVMGRTAVLGVEQNVRVNEDHA